MLMKKVRRIAAPMALIACACGDGDDTPGPDSEIPSLGGSPTAVALALPTAVAELGTLTLDGSASSDSAGETLSYLWEQVSGPTATIGDPSAVATALTVPAVNENRSISIRLTVTNTSGRSNSDLVFVTIVDGGVAPEAVAGTNQAVDAGTTVTLDGSASSDDGTLSNFLWERLAGPTIAFDDQDGTRTTFVAPDVTEPATLLIQLTVTDDDGIADSAVLEVLVNPVPVSVAFVSVPAEVLRNTPLDPIGIEVRNASGARIMAGQGSERTISLEVTNGASTLTGPLSIETMAGLARLNNSSYPQVEAAVELTATSPELAPATVPFNVVWPAVFPGIVPAELRIEDLVQLSSSESNIDDFAIAYTTAGTVDLDLSGTSPVEITSDAQDLAVVRYGTDGSVRWSRHFPVADDQRAVGIAATSDEDLIVLFELRGAVDFARESPALELVAEGPTNVGVVRIDGVSGDVEWGTRFGGASTALPTDLALASNDDPIVVGHFTGTFDADPSPATDARVSDGVDGFIQRISNSALSGSGGQRVAFAETPTVSGSERFNAVALTNAEGLVAVGAQASGGRAWVYRMDEMGAFVRQFTFAGSGVTNEILDVEARGSSIQVVGAVSGDTDFGDGQVVLGAGGTDGFFAVFTDADDSLAFVRTVAGTGDDQISRMARTGAFDASFVLAGTIQDSADFEFGLSQETLSVTGNGTFALSLAFDGEIRWLVELASGFDPSLELLVAEPDDTVWFVVDLQGSGDFDADPFETSVPVTVAPGDSWVVHVNPAAELVVP